MKLSVLSAGGVTPAGLGSDAITAPWPAAATTSAAGRPVRAGLVDPRQPGLVRWEKEPRLRRASPITYFMIEAVDQALQAAPDTDRDRTGIIAAFFLGCLVYSVRFYRQITTEGRRFASPVLFPETVFNSPLSHVVATLGLGGPAYSQIGDKSCWATALRTARCWLARGECDRVIVVGAEEFEPHEVDALHAGGLLRGGLQPCEGAVALLLAPSDGTAPALHGVQDGFSFTSRNNAAAAAARRGLEQHRILHRLGDGARLLHRGYRPGRARHQRHAQPAHGVLGRDLVAHQPDVVRRRADEGEAMRFHHLGESGVLAEEAVARMNGVGARDGGGREDVRDVEVALTRGRGADAHAFVGEAHMHRRLVGGAVHGHRADAHLLAGAMHPQRDFATVGDQDLLHLRRRGPIPRAPGARRIRRACRLRPGCG